MEAFLGIDVQSRRDLSYFSCGEDGEVVTSGWLEAGQDPRRIAREIRRRGYELVAIGIDAPRQFLPKLREWYWVRRGKTWRRRRVGDKGIGRHCEVVVAAHRLANPQWTPLANAAPEWMKLGVRIHGELEAEASVYEVFPSASYRMLRYQKELIVTLDLSMLAPGPKDMLDACVAAVTVREFVRGRGCAVGGGDMLGEIILPGQLNPMMPEVCRWPCEDHSKVPLNPPAGADG